MAPIDINRSYPTNIVLAALRARGLAIDGLAAVLDRALHSSAAVTQVVAPVRPLRASSVSASHIRCLECSKAVRSIAQHVSTAHGIIFDSYRVRWGLADGYPRSCTDSVARRAAASVQAWSARDAQ